MTLQTELPRMFVFCGFSGSGKTTFAKKFASYNRLYYVSPEIIYKTRCGKEYDPSCKFDVWITFFMVIETFRKKNKDIVVDVTALTKFEREQFLNWFPGFEHHLIYIETPFALCLQNNSCREKVVPMKTMRAQKKKFEKPTYNEDHRWATFTHLKNLNNAGFVLHKLYVKVSSLNETIL